MTVAVRRLVDRLATLPEERQDSWAQTWLSDLSTETIEDEIASGARPIPPRLQELIAKAESDIAAGRTYAMEDVLG